jgi:hypothetical protein
MHLNGMCGMRRELRAQYIAYTSICTMHKNIIAVARYIGGRLETHGDEDSQNPKTGLKV